MASIPFVFLFPDAVFVLVGLLAALVLRFIFRWRWRSALGFGVVLFVVFGIVLSFLPLETHVVRLDLPKSN
ncbi:MAG TPA: hypothetical protein VNU97_06595 [Rhizomicrobium sp.]|jgi:hypothetical protein|nr:hypothetical protein [Rhizomicrobium sp.]